MGAFVRATRKKLLHVAARIGSPQDAEDTVQAAYHALLRRGEPPPDAPFAWLLTSVVRIAYRRKAVARRFVTLAERLARPVSRTDPAACAGRAEERHLIRREVARLPMRFRDAVVLHYLEGLSVAEVAKLVDVPTATVKTRLHRGRALLRGRLAPLLACTLLAAPWVLADAARAVVRNAPTILGGTMKAKTTSVVLGVALATGALGVGVGVHWREDNLTADRGHARDNGRARTIAMELAEERERSEQLARRLQEARTRLAAVSGANAAVEAKGTDSRGRSTPRAQDPDGVSVPKQAARIAAKMQLSPEALRAAIRARDGCKALWGRGQHSQAEIRTEYRNVLDELARHGEQGYLAVLALLRAGEQGIWFERLLTDAYRPAWERHLLDAAADKSMSVRARSSILVGLGAADTPEVRRFLNEYIAETDDAGLFMSTARALGRLGDDTSARVVEGRLGLFGYEGVEGYLLGALGEMGGPESTAVLVRYLENPRSNAKFLSTAAHALARTDPALAAEHARRILEGPRASQLSKDGKTWLVRISGGD